VCQRAVVLHLEQGFAAVGLPVPVGAVTQPLWDAVDGLRLTDLASRAGISKQSMGELVVSMEQAGYIEGVAHPTDKRARLWRLTRRGRSAGKLARKLVREVEAEWTKLVGAPHMKVLVESLSAIAASLSATRQ
jgi:DNA-binding MarR family transcriptional regulator